MDDTTRSIKFLSDEMNCCAAWQANLWFSFVCVTVGEWGELPKGGGAVISKTRQREDTDVLRGVIKKVW